MEIAPDFFDYFEAASALLEMDKYVSFHAFYLLHIKFEYKKLGILGFQ